MTLDASLSTTSGDLSYQWIDLNDLIDEADLNSAASFSVVGLQGGTYSFSLIVFDGLQESTRRLCYDSR